MFKKIILLAMSVAALVAFAAPAAQASGPLITNFLGEKAETIEAHGEDVKTVTETATLECATVNLHINLPTNAATTAHGSGTGTAVGTPLKTMTGHCGTSVGIPVHIKSVTVDTIHLTRHLNGGVLETTGTANFTYTYVLTHPQAGEIHCTFKGTGVKVTKTGTDTIQVSGEVVKAEPSSALCAAKGQLSGNFTVTDEFGEPAHIH